MGAVQAAVGAATPLSTVMTIVGTSGGLWGTIQMGIAYFKEPLPKHGVMMKFAAGLDGSGAPGAEARGRIMKGAGGDVPEVEIYSESGEPLGKRHWHNTSPAKAGWLRATRQWEKEGDWHVETGSTAEIIVKLNNGQQPTYGLFKGRKNSICIAYIVTAFPDGQTFGWIGDWQAYCKRGEWYYSDIHFEGQELKCAWLHETGDGIRHNAAIQIHFPSFHPSVAEKKGIKHFCEQTPTLRFSPNRNEPFYWPHGKVKRDLGSDAITSVNSTHEKDAGDEADVDEEIWREPEPKVRDPRVVRTVRASHSAVDLCNDPISRGPDLLNVPEGMFCDMLSRTLWPMCAEPTQLDCFDRDAMVLRPSSTPGLYARSLDAGIMNYTQVIDWK